MVGHVAYHSLQSSAKVKNESEMHKNKIYFIPFLEIFTTSIVVVVILVVGPISTADMKTYFTLTPPIGVPSFIFRGAAHQAA
jgi:hypothetical protein